MVERTSSPIEPSSAANAQLVEFIDREVSKFRSERDCYFECHPTASQSDYARELKERAAVLLQEVSLVGSETNVRVMNALLCGKILNVLPDYEPKCEEYLTKAVKLDPDSVESLNELGECLWKKPDRRLASKCFEMALEKRANPVSLRSLSTALRQDQCSVDDDKVERIKQSVQLAKRAVDLDANDDQSWYILGNAYLTYFFSTGQVVGSHIKNALAAYAKAVELGCCSAELYFNYAQAQKFEQNYADALYSLQRSFQLDPTFTEARDAFTNLKAFLRRLHDTIERRGKLRPKRIHEMCTSFNSATDYGPYAKPAVDLQTGNAIKFDPVDLTGLRPGANADKLVLVKVIAPVVNEETLPYTCVVIDNAANVYALTIFNCVSDFGLLIGATLAVPKPYLLNVQCCIDDQCISFNCIRVASPEMLVLNGNRVARDQVAMAEADSAVD